MTFEIHYSKAADRDLSKLPIEVIRKIVFAISDIKEDPFSHIHKMKGVKNPPQYKF